MKKILIITLMATLILLSERVDALSYTTEVQQVSSGWIDWSNISNQNEWTVDFGGYLSQLSNTTTNNWQVRYLTFTTPLNVVDYDFISIPFNVSQPVRNLETSAINQIYCQEWGLEQNGDYYCMDGQIDTSHLDIPYTIEISNANFRFHVVYEDNNWNTCDLSDGMIMCPTIHKKIKRIDIYYLFKTVTTTNFVISVGGGFRVYNYNSPTQAIENQTQQQQQNHDQFMNSNQTYADEQDTNMRGVNETMEFEQAESQLIESLDMNTSIVDEIIINPDASRFIWNIVEVLRSMNPAIILLMGSMLGMGILKLVLNR